jgi:hypothetical protein
LIRASWLIRGTPVPVINRRTRINHGNGTCGINGADEATPGGDHTPATASMTSRRTGPAGQSCCAPLSGPGCHPPLCCAPGDVVPVWRWAAPGAQGIPGPPSEAGEPQGSPRPSKVKPRVHQVAPKGHRLSVASTGSRWPGQALAHLARFASPGPRAHARAVLAGGDQCRSPRSRRARMSSATRKVTTKNSRIMR